MAINPLPAIADPARLAAAKFVTGGLWIDADHILRYDPAGDPRQTGRDRVVVDLLPEATTQPIIKPRSIIHHTQSGPKRTRWQSLVAYMRRADVSLDCHLLYEMDGLAVQTMPFNRRGDCNYKANSFRVGSDPTLRGAIASEAQDNGQATVDTTGFTWEQITTHADVDALLCIAYGIGCSWPVAWNGTGIGCHNLFREWSLRQPNQCPGKARRAQLPAIHSAVAERLSLYGQMTGWECRATA
jgi:hypothetical protein